MKILIEVKEWILSARPDFKKGVELYQQIYPNNSGFIRLILQPSAEGSHYNREKIFMDIKDYYLKNRHLLIGLESKPLIVDQPRPAEKVADLGHIESKLDDLDSSVEDLESKVEDLDSSIGYLKDRMNNLATTTIQEVKPPSGGRRKDRYPAELHPYVDEQVELYKKRDFTFYRVQAGAVRGQKNLKVAAQFLRQAEIRIKEIWFALDYYDNTKCILPAFLSEKNAEAYLKLERRRNTVRTYVSKYKKMLKKASEEDKVEINSKLSEYSYELENLEKQLGL